MLLLVLIAVPVGTAALVFRCARGRIAGRDAALQIAVGVALMVVGYYVLRWVGVQDYEVWSGRIARTDHGTTGCCHDYACNCRQECTTSGEQRSCSDVCDVCYLHSYDEQYSATSTNDERVYHDTCNEPGSDAPADWLAIRVGEPTAWEHRYTNYVLAAPAEVIAPVPDMGRYLGLLPAYPRTEGWEVRRFLFAGIAEPPDAGALDEGLDELNADIGAAKQVNVIVVVVRAADRSYADALRAAWLGGKKNDVVVVIGAPEFPEIRWARVLAWSAGPDDGAGFKMELGGRIEGLRRFDGAAALAAIREEVVRGHVRRPFAELAELMTHARPPGWATALLVFLGIAVPATLAGAWWGRWDRRRGPAARG